MEKNSLLKLRTQIILLRGVNVGGNNVVPMADLTAWLTRLGFADVRTLLQSGNVVLRTRAASGAKLEKQLESAAEQDLKLKADFMVRTPAEWSQLIAANPFPAEARRDPGRLVALVLKGSPSPAQAAALAAAIPGREQAVVKGNVAYLYYPDGSGASKLTPALLNRTLGFRGTARNWNTILKIAALAVSLETE